VATHLIKKYLQEFAQWLRNLDSYDDFDYGTEPIPGDRTWCKKCNKSSCRINKLEDKE
jgi:hypothetical protein